MKKTHNTENLAQHRKWLSRLAQGIIASTIAVFCIAAPMTAKADVITTYNLNVTAEVTSYCCAVLGDFITITGQFQYDNTLGKITSDTLKVTGNLQGGNLPAGGVVLNTAITGSEDAYDIYAFSADSNYQLAFQFVNSLSLGQADLIAQQPYTDSGDAYFYDAYDAYSRYHVGYATVSGGASPVPEPSSMLLLGASLLSLVFIRRRLVGVSGTVF